VEAVMCIWSWMTHDPNKAKKALRALGLGYKEADVLDQELPNAAGALGYFAGKLAHKEIDIASGWGTALKESKTAAVVIGVSDLDKVARVREMEGNYSRRNGQDGWSATAGHSPPTGNSTNRPAQSEELSKACLSRWYDSR
jgi:hypothetical protein